jgi:hypothetical protein
LKLIANIRSKLAENELTIRKSDKGKSTVILTREEYKQNVKKNLIQGNQFTILDKNPIQNYKKKL